MEASSIPETFCIHWRIEWNYSEILPVIMKGCYDYFILKFYSLSGFYYCLLVPEKETHGK